jgi:hypothetical protein
MDQIGRLENPLTPVDFVRELKKSTEYQNVLNILSNWIRVIYTFYPQQSVQKQFGILVKLFTIQHDNLQAYVNTINPSQQQSKSSPAGGSASTGAMPKNPRVRPVHMAGRTIESGNNHRGDGVKTSSGVNRR